MVREFERERERERGFMMQGAKGVTMTRTSFVGARVTVRAPVTGRRACGGTRRTVTSAKYGEEGKYFDLNVSCACSELGRTPSRARRAIC